MTKWPWVAFKKDGADLALGLQILTNQQQEPVPMAEAARSATQGDDEYKPHI